MSNTSTESIPNANVQVSEASKEHETGAAEDNMKPTEEQVRRSDRQRTLTAKAKENKGQELERNIWYVHNGLSLFVASIENKDLSQMSNNDLVQVQERLEQGNTELFSLIDQYKDLALQNDPDPDFVQVVDKLCASINRAMLRVRRAIDRVNAPSLVSIRSGKSRSPFHSAASVTSSTKAQLLLKAAALQAELQCEEEEAAKEEEILSLEIEETRRRAEAQALLKRKQRELAHQSLRKQLLIEQAKLNVVQQQEALEDGIQSIVNSPSCDLPVENEDASEDVLGVKLKNNSTTSPADILADLDVKSGDKILPIVRSDNASRPKPVEPSSQKVSDSVNQTNKDLTTLTEAFTASVSLSRLPVPEPAVFVGDPLEYPDWLASFSTLVETRGIPPRERIHYLKRYVGGPAREAVSGYFLLKSDRAFEKAKEILQERYGNPFVVSEAFRTKLESWPKISGRDNKGLRRFSDFLLQCQIAMEEVEELSVLNDSRENRKLLQKLPEWLVARWSRSVSKTKEITGKYPKFSDFTTFITTEAKIACDPITSLVSLRSGSEREENDHYVKPKKKGPGAHTLASRVQQRDFKVKSESLCCFCKKKNHTLQDCRFFMTKPMVERTDFIRENKLCFACLQEGHMSRKCPQRANCKRCQRRHPTCLHMEQSGGEDKAREDKEQSGGEGKAREDKTLKSPNSEVKIKDAKDVACRGVICADGAVEGISSMVVPVWLSSAANPDKEHLTYALLDTMSDTTFILTETSEALYDQRKQMLENSTPVSLRLTTMTAKDKSIEARKFKDLVVRGYDSEKRIILPSAYSRNFIPVERSHIPTPETARRWPHLRGIAHRLQSIKDCEVGLLIGYDCPRALAPRNCLTGEGNEPFAVETDLGWSIVGKLDRREDSGDAIRLTYNIMTREVPCELRPNLPIKSVPGEPAVIPSKVSFAMKTSVKEEVLRPIDVAQILESDFGERENGKMLSQEDIRFLKTVEEGIHQEDDGFFSLPLPFKGRRPDLPNNKYMAKIRLDQLKRKFQKDPKHFEHYCAFMDAIFEKGEAEEIEDDSKDIQKIWYIPHHGVYHSKKPDKIRVVFDCAAKFKGTSLNEHLLQGPDQLNTLIGVLCRFRKEPIAIQCDIERMYHRFRVNKEDRDYLRFLWWENNKIDQEPKTYRMKAHIFGAVSSPGCAIFTLKHIARKYQHISSEASDFISKDFYMDDGLTSVNSVESAINLIEKSREICAKGNVRLHKFASNSRQLLESIPCSERAKDLLDLDLSLEELQIERVLGIKWCIESDQFQFKIAIQDQPVTRRGILSSVASVFDPLGWIAPFVLQGKQILQDICKEGCSWDDPLPIDIEKRWEVWKSQIPELASISLPRCYKPSEFGNVVNKELHHFSDASTTGYGQC